VAYRVALKELRKKCTAREEPLGEVVASEQSPLEEVSRRHEEHVVDEELTALGDKHRRPLVLHYLAGRTNREIADELGLSVSAVEGRLRRAKAQLRRRLVRRGITLSVLGTVVASSRQAAEASLSAGLIRDTVQSSVLYAAGKAGGTTASCELAQSEVLAMASATRTIGMCLAATAFVACVGAWSVGALVVAVEPEAAAEPLAASAGGEIRPPAPAVVAMGDRAAMPASESADAVGPSQYREAIRRIEASLHQVFDPAGLQGKKSLEEVAREFSRQLRVPVVLDRRALEDVGLSSDTELEIELEEAALAARSVLRLMLDQHDLDYILTNEVLLITTPEEAEMRPDVRVYSTRSLAVPADQIAEIITGGISPDSWSEVGGPGVISVLPDGTGFVISQMQRVHEEIADLLEQLRRNAQGTGTDGGIDGAGGEGRKAKG
jgi:hypothetical protein